MRRVVIALLLGLTGLSFLCADPTLVYRGEPLYEQVRRLVLAAETAPPPRVSPTTYGELLLTMRRIDVGALPRELVGEFREVYAELSARDQESPTDARVPYGSVGVESNVELYLHTADEADEWRHWYPDRRPILSVPMRAWPMNGMYIAFDLDWRKNYPMYPGYPNVDTINPDPITNIPFDVLETDMQFPFQALVSLGGDRWSLQFGRSRVAMGFGETGSLMLGDHVEYHDFLLANVTGHLFSYRALYLDLEPWITTTTSADERIIFGHRLEMRPAPWLSLAANEFFVFAYHPVELRYLNPLMIMHSWFVTDLGNDFLNFEFSVRPLRGLELYGHLAVDQLQSAVERERGYGETEPEAFGYLAGAQYTAPWREGWLTAGTEWVFTDPWLYLGRRQLTGFTYRRRVQAENVLPSATKLIVEKSLGYPAGPDYYGITAYLHADYSPGFRAGGDLTYGVKGENDIQRYLPADDLEDAQRTTPSGDAPEHIIAGRLVADAKLARFSIGRIPVTVRGGAILDVVHVWDNDHVPGARYFDVQFSPYLSLETTSVIGSFSEPARAQ